MPRLARLLLDIASGMLHLHSQKPDPIIHRDIRCANILLHKDGHAVLGDWGLSRSVSEGGGDEKEEQGNSQGKKKKEAGERKANDDLSSSNRSGYVPSAGSMTPWPWTAPEALLCGVFSPSSDVYMFGVSMR